MSRPSEPSAGTATATMTPDQILSDVEWLIANHGSFGRTSDLTEPGRDSIFCRVPCARLYEWHCYDGASWQEALANARADGPCIETGNGRCSKSRFCDGEEHPIVRELARLRAYRAPCWEWTPSEGDGGLPRVDWLKALLSDVRAWFNQYPQILADHADSDALLEGVRECETLYEGLRDAVNDERTRAAAAPTEDAT